MVGYLYYGTENLQEKKIGHILVAECFCQELNGHLGQTTIILTCSLNCLCTVAHLTFMLKHTIFYS